MNLHRHLAARAALANAGWPAERGAVCIRRTMEAMFGQPRR